MGPIGPSYGRSSAPALLACISSAGARAVVPVTRHPNSPHLTPPTPTPTPLLRQVNLGPDGLIPLEVRFLHDPWKPHGFVGAALSSNIIGLKKVGSGAQAAGAGAGSAPKWGPAGRWAGAAGLV